MIIHIKLFLYIYIINNLHYSIKINNFIFINIYKIRFANIEFFNKTIIINKIDKYDKYYLNK